MNLLKKILKNLKNNKFNNNNNNKINSSIIKYDNKGKNCNLNEEKSEKIKVGIKTTIRNDLEEEKMSLKEYENLFNFDANFSDNTVIQDDKIPEINEYPKLEITKTIQNKISHLQEITNNIEKTSAPKVKIDIDFSNLKIHYKDELNKNQFFAVTSIDGPLLIIAGAGSGKTRVLSYRVAYMIERGIHPGNILLLTFTRKASKEMLDRTKILLKEKKITNISGGTFHSFANNMLRKYSRILNINPKFTVIDTIDSQDVIDLVRKELRFEKREKAFPRKRIIQAIISKSRNCQKTIKQIINIEYEGVKEFSDDIENIYKYYKKYNESHYQLDYDDLLEILLHSLKKNIRFREIIQDKYKYIMVDEFQDTNIVQKKIVDEIARKYKNIMVVGDDSQSIYAFRGANFENILLFPETYKNCQIIKLEQNYRSNQSLLNFSNDIIRNFTIGYKKHLFSLDKTENIPIVHRFYNQEKEAQWIVEKIIGLQEKEISLKNISVLYRAGYHSNFIQAELLKRSIPFVVYGGIKFIERRHIKDIIAYLRIILNPLNAVSWNRILKLILGIGNITASKIVQSIHKNSGIISFDSYKNKKYYKELYKLEKVLTENLNPEDSVVKKVENLKKYYIPILKSLENDYEIRILDIDVLISLATTYNTKLEKFLTDFALDPPSNKLQDSTMPTVKEDDEDKLVLSTVHSAKGLEWNYVFIVHMLDGLFPSMRSLNSIEDLEEERRLFYVATTRAKDELFITLPSFVSSYNAFFTLPSRFIAEINKQQYKYFLGGKLK